MQSQKVYLKYDFDDYDPCESSDDITTNDLTALKKEKEARERKLLQGEEGEDVEEEEEEEEEDTLGFLYRRGGTGKDGAISRKRNCKKVRKNPFFVDRLTFSANLPPPPPHPPPQFFPPVEEEDNRPKICLKRKRKCRKRKDFGIGEEEEGEEGETGDDGYDEWGRRRSRGSRDGLGEDLGDGNEGDDDGRRRHGNGYDDDGMGRHGNGYDNDGRGRRHGSGSDDDGKRRGRRKCGKAQERPPCRKKSDVSISLLPRQIPAKQRDLPATSPLTLPEVKRQIMISCKENCPKDCTKTKRKCKKKSE